MGFAPKSARNVNSTATSNTGPRKDPSTTEGSPDDLTLDEAKREYLWDLEHHSNVLNQHGLKRIGALIREQNAAELRKLLADDFTGQLLNEHDPLLYSSETLVLARAAEATHDAVPATADEFVTWALAQGQLFRDISGTQFGVKRIGPVRDGEVDGPWWVWCMFRIWGTGKDGSRRETSYIWSLNVRRPTEEHLASGGWLLSAKVLQSADSHSPESLFKDVTADVGLETDQLYDNWNTDNKLQSTGGIYATDYNRDGYTDFLITDLGTNLETMYRGTASGKFENVTSQLGLDAPLSLPRASICVAFVDLDGDGWDDLISSNGIVRRNAEGKSFADFTGHSNFALVSLATRPAFGPAISGIIAADFDRDGKLDLYLTRIGNKPTSWLLETNERYMPNQLLRNVGNWRFEDMTTEYGVDGGGRSCFSAAWFDSNNDQWPDLYVINEFGDGVLYLNREGKGFDQVNTDDEVADFGSMGLTTGDIDNDGNIDLYIAAMYSKAGSRIIGNLPETTYERPVMKRLRSLVDGSEMYRNAGGLKFRASGQDDQVHDVGWAWGPVLADFDNDGWLDLYATAGYMSRDRSKPDG